jgi:hypothetical protein
MSLPLSGAISMSQIDDALSQTTTQQISLNDSNARTLSGVLSNKIAFSDFYGKTMNLTNENGWFAGGFVSPYGGQSYPYYNSVSDIERIIYATDTNVAIFKGPLIGPGSYLSCVFNSTDAWFIGGNSNGVYGNNWFSRITFSSDTAQAVNKGGPYYSLPYLQNIGAAGSTDFSMFGWVVGGCQGLTYIAILNPYQEWIYPNSNASSISKIAFASDTVNLLANGTLSLSRSLLCGISKSTQAWFAGGSADQGVSQYADLSRYSTIDSITYSTDNTLANVRGPLVQEIAAMSAVGNSTNGWFSGSDFTKPTTLTTYKNSTVQRITFSTDSLSAVVRGTLDTCRYSMTGSSNNSTDGWFVGGIAYQAFGYYSGGWVMSGLNIYATSYTSRLTFATDTMQLTTKGGLNYGKAGISSV